MGPESRKDETTSRAERPPERERGDRPDEMGDEASARQQAVDPREDEGWSQPESSAQKGGGAEEPES
jgi:hypothetical protein